MTRIESTYMILLSLDTLPCHPTDSARGDKRAQQRRLQTWLPVLAQTQHSKEPVFPMDRIAKFRSASQSCLFLAPTQTC